MRRRVRSPLVFRLTRCRQRPQPVGLMLAFDGLRMREIGMLFNRWSVQLVVPLIRIKDA